MEFILPVMVSVDRREHYEVLLPGLAMTTFRGPSLARLLDDVTLNLMEAIPKESMQRMAHYGFCPEVELRKVRIEGQWCLKGHKQKTTWKGRLSVVLMRWPSEDHWLFTLPRMTIDWFAVAGPHALNHAVTRWVQRWATAHGALDLDNYACRAVDYLELLDFDADLPTLLSSQPKRRRKKAAKPQKKTQKPKKKKRELIPAVTLRQVGTNLTHRAIDGRLGIAYGRESLVEDLYLQMSRDGASLLLVGPTGVGKTAVVGALVHRMLQDAINVQDRRDVWQVDGNRIIAGMSMVGAWENRVSHMVAELSARQDILYVNDLPALVFTGRSAHSDSNVAEFLQSHLARGEIRIIGECTPERLAAIRDEAPGFFARFRIVDVPEMPERDTLVVLAHAVRAFAEADDITVDPQALESVLALTRRFEARAAHPGKAVSLLSRVLADHTSVVRDDLGRRQVFREQVISYYGRQTGLPKFVLWEKESRPYDKIRAFFERRIVAQPEAIEAGCDVVALLEQGLNDPERPLSTFLFVGPTGVGKTETAKALAEFLFGASDRLIRFDMSEFMDPGTVVRLFGDRFSPDGELTRRVAQQPFSIVLLDEIEKAHPSVFDTFLQVLGEGRLTNAAGVTVDFTSCVIIMTSNLGVREAGRKLGFGSANATQIARHYAESAERFFRPEFFNRLDRVVPFSPLGKEAIVPLVERLLEQMMTRRGLRRNSVVVNVDPRVVDVVVEQGFDPKYGARSVKRVLEKRLAVPLAQHLVTRTASDVTLADLYEQNKDVAIDVVYPQDEVRPKCTLPPLKDHKDIERQQARVKRLLEQIQTSGNLQALREEHSAMLARFNQGDSNVTNRLLEVGDVFKWIEKVSEDVRVLSEELTPASFEEGWDRQRVYEGWDIKETLAPMVRLVREVRSPVTDGLREELRYLLRSVAGLHFHIKAVIADDTSPMLLRILPRSRDRAAILWAHRMTVTLGEGGLWHATQWFVRQRDWVECSLKNLLNTADEATGFAVEISGSGLGALVAPELGCHVNVEELGPDLVTSVVEVEDVSSSDAPLARLHALQKEQEERLAARYHHGEEKSPLPPLSIVRRYYNGGGQDLETDIILDEKRADWLANVIQLRQLSRLEDES